MNGREIESERERERGREGNKGWGEKEMKEREGEKEIKEREGEKEIKDGDRRKYRRGREGGMEINKKTGRN